MADVTITYQGTDIVELSDSATKTLKTGGTYCEDDIEVEYVKPSGGNIEGLQLVSVNSTTGRPTEYKWKGDTIPVYGLHYCYYGTGNNQRCTIDLTEVEYVNTYGLANSGLEIINADNIKEIDSYGLSLRSSVSTNDLRSKTLNLANYTGYGIGGKTNINSVMRSSDASNFFGTILCPVIELIPQYMFYSNKNDMTVQLGSIGHAVQECKSRPFGSAATGTNTVTVYVTGDKLDTIKTAIQEQTPSTTTFIYKAAETTTYNGTTYQADATILTSTGA